ncbi:MAG: ATP-binding cassette domain-containing protein, partial [Anaerolineae bacterium]|nr:ATP-binding cassette domain-containing protein [Anaerolineae bacterium]
MTYVQEPVFTDVSWEIHRDKVAGLVGPNGAGKSTILKVIAGEVPSESGFTVPGKKGLTVGYLHQEPRLTTGRSVLEEAHSASTELHEVERRLAQVEAEMAQPDVYGDEKKLTR